MIGEQRGRHAEGYATGLHLYRRVIHGAFHRVWRDSHHCRMVHPVDDHWRLCAGGHHDPDGPLRKLHGIAYDSGGVTTSTITVPLVTALGGTGLFDPRAKSNAGRFWSDRLCLAITHDIRDGFWDGDQHMIQLVLEWAGLFPEYPDGCCPLR